ncbi:hypothetical protein [Deinococcus yavapaiensis]|uniref:Uncharacterized protein n=1 Tax=Deinococcus yavapaiensis KR-236 TaxID=694435 RepID=A0A318S6Y3_9DEIO|nr:hypothetical protein [Deinococcus yavapaiensis]PYE53399.1 hypothetical protein DES52_109176 [Deinococcus yavapaiensis KR-236]
MTTPTPDLEAILQDAVFARKLALALMSVLQDKNILSEQDVAVIIGAARRSAVASSTSNAVREEARAVLAPEEETRRETDAPPPLLLDLEL